VQWDQLGNGQFLSKKNGSTKHARGQIGVVAKHPSWKLVSGRKREGMVVPSGAGRQADNRIWNSNKDKVSAV
jgi:hypothetical protein